MQAAAAKPSSSPTRRRSPTPIDDTLLFRLMSDPAFSDALERRYFQFFRQRTIVSATSLIGSRFWDRTVLQAVHLEPAVRHAVLALAGLHQVSEMAQSNDDRQRHLAFTERQHHKALEAAKLLVASAQPQDVDRVLIACVIFICYEAVRGNYRASQVHMASGRAIWMSNHDRLMHVSRRNDLAEIVHALARLDLSALTFQDSSTSIPLTLSDLYRSEATLEVFEFDSVAEARSSLTNLTRWTMLVDVPGDGSENSGASSQMYNYLCELAKCAAQMQSWRHELDILLKRQPELASTLPVQLLRLQHAGASALLEAGAFGPETRWDRKAVLAHFTEAISSAERVVAELAKSESSGSFSVEPGYIDVCFSAATRCRDPFLRRRAIEVLRAIPRQENKWHSVPAAAIAEAWVAVEENGLENVQQPSDVPECNRTHMIDVTADVAAQTIAVRFFIGSASEEEQIVRNVTVRW